MQSTPKLANSLELPGNILFLIIQQRARRDIAMHIKLVSIILRLQYHGN